MMGAPYTDEGEAVIAAFDRAIEAGRKEDAIRGCNRGGLGIRVYSEDELDAIVKELRYLQGFIAGAGIDDNGHFDALVAELNVDL